MVRGKASARIQVRTTRTVTRSLRPRPAIRYAEPGRGRGISARGRGGGVERRQATQQLPSVVLESTEVSVTTAEAVSGSETAAATPSSTRGLPAAVVDAAFAAAEAIAAGVPVSGGGRALGAPADVSEGLPSLVDTSARQDASDEARKKGTRREISITETNTEREGIQGEEEELKGEDEATEGPVDVVLGEETGSEGGGGENVEEMEQSPALETRAISAEDKAAEEMTTSPAAAGKEITGSDSRAAGRWALRSHGKAPEREKRGAAAEVQRQETRRIKVRMDGNEVTYDINTTAPLRNMFALFCQRLHLPEGGVTFCKDGHLVRGNQTVMDARLADGSIIEGYYQKYAGTMAFLGHEKHVCCDDSSAPVSATSLDELHSLQKKPTSVPGGGAESISASLASHARERGPNVIKGDPNTAVTKDGHVHFVPSDYVSDFNLKATHVLHNLSQAELYELAIKDEKGTYITSTGALATLSGAKTGRSPKDKRIVKEETSQDDLWWGKGSPNIEMDEETFYINRERAVDYLKSLDKVFVNDQFLNWDKDNRVKVRIITSRAYHALFMHNMCIRPTPEELETFGEPDFTIYNGGKFPCNRFTHYMTSSTSIDINLKRREMVILGTQYAGEMKKGLFGFMHYLMPKRGILSLHSGCNMGKGGDVSLFFGLSGTGKTTLSTDPERYLIGDDEHCWSDNGISNIEGGCYAKCIDLSPEKEPEIFNAIKFGTVLENVVFDSHTRVVDYADKSVTENTRAAYPIEYIPNAKIPCVGPHPRNVILLACDAFGVLPPVSKLTLPQTMYHFISGYTALVAGTEEGIKEPQATFSACFGAAFIMWHPIKYAGMLAQRMHENGTSAWLVNTGWSGGSYGVGSRMKLAYTRKIIDAIHNGSLGSATYKPTPIFGLQVPDHVDGVPQEILEPQNMWTDKGAYNSTLTKLGGLFNANFSKFTESMSGVDTTLAQQILSAGPQLA
ncbi:unnamed protein product [Closterium sp. Yama58-4]|nr:unnamed protein product [Closterium sp. Yama58-4]